MLKMGRGRGRLIELNLNSLICCSSGSTTLKPRGDNNKLRSAQSDGSWNFIVCKRSCLAIWKSWQIKWFSMVLPMHIARKLLLMRANLMKFRRCQIRFLATIKRGFRARRAGRVQFIWPNEKRMLGWVGSETAGMCSAACNRNARRVKAAGAQHASEGRFRHVGRPRRGHAWTRNQGTF